MNRKRFFIGFLCFLCAGMVTAQTLVQIRGSVVDETGEPVIGANILVKGTTQGTTSDVDGQFSLSVDRVPVTLQISYTPRGRGRVGKNGQSTDDAGHADDGRSGSHRLRYV